MSRFSKLHIRDLLICCTILLRTLHHQLKREVGFFDRDHGAVQVGAFAHLQRRRGAASLRKRARAVFFHMQDSWTRSKARREGAEPVAQLLNGKGADLHSAMIASKSRPLVSADDAGAHKIVQAYQQISNMQF